MKRDSRTGDRVPARFVRTLAIVSTLLILEGAGASAATAEEPVVSAYGGSAAVLGEVASGGPASKEVQSRGAQNSRSDKVSSDPEQLAFTGQDLGLLALVGVALVGCGVGIDRAARRTGLL